MFTSHIRSFFGGKKEKLCFNFAKHWSVKQIANTFSRSFESRSKALAKLSNCQQSWIQRSHVCSIQHCSTVWPPMLEDVRPNIFCWITCWMEFAFDQKLRPTILLDATMLHCFAAPPTKLCPEWSHVRAASQSRNAILFLTLGF